MKIGFEYDGASALLGWLAAMVYVGHLPWFWLYLGFACLVRVPGLTIPLVGKR